MKHHRRTVWLPKWSALVDAFDGPLSLAQEIGVVYQTLRRWGRLGEPVPPSAAKLIRLIAARAGVESPV